MQAFTGKESCREQDFGKLFREYLEGILPAVQIKHQTRGVKIIDIQLQVQVCASCCFRSESHRHLMMKLSLNRSTYHHGVVTVCWRLHLPTTHAASQLLL